MLARDSNHLPFTPATAVRLGAGAALVGGIVGIAHVLTWAVQGPDYYRVSPAFVDLFSMAGFYVAQLMCILGFFGLYGAVAARTRHGRPSGMFLVGGALGAAAATLWLAQTGIEVASGVAAWPHALDGTIYVSMTLLNVLFIGGFACWIAGLVALGVAAVRSRLSRRLYVLPFATVALWPASLAASALLSGLYPAGHGARVVWFDILFSLGDALPFLGSLLIGLVLLRNLDDVGPGTSVAVPVGPAENRGPVAERFRSLLGSSRQTSRDLSTTEVEREKELLGALRRCGELTVAGAALETTLTVEEADQMLSILSAKGHLEVRVEHGRLLYSLWEVDG